MKALKNCYVESFPERGLHRHEGRLFKLLLRRRLRGWFSRLLGFLRAFWRILSQPFSWSGRLVMRVGPHERSRIQEEWRRYDHWGGGPPHYR